MIIYTIMNKQRGFVILYAVLLVSIVLTVSLTLLNITLKQLILSLVARESSYAFYAADSAKTCAQYWDSHYDDSNPFGWFEYNLATSEYEFTDPTQQSFFCGRGKVNAVTVPVPHNDRADTVSTFTVVFPVADDQRLTCANVEVTKYTNRSNLELFGKTLIKVHGYNFYDTARDVCPQATDRATERGISVGPY
jgi:hypothetical protein